VSGSSASSVLVKYFHIVFDTWTLIQRIAGEIKSFSTDGWVAPKLAKRMDKFMLYLITAGKKALENGGLTEDIMNELDKTRCGVLVGSAMGGMKVCVLII
jgi:3-oxoacyl-[acyl-carrier-protein] synthase II